jgi:phage shock protein A
MEQGRERPDNPSRPMTEEIRTLTAEIRALMDQPTAPLSVLEDTLTTGYARALELERERGRLERRLGEVVAEGDGELAQELAERVASTEEHISRLRALLEKLRDRAAAVRAA